MNRKAKNLLVLAMWSLFPLVSLAEINQELKLNIETSFSEFMEHVEDPKYQIGLITYEIDGESKVKEIKIKARGNFRRKHCELPPLRIKFSDSVYDVEMFDEQKSIKLVNECNLDSLSQNLIVREHLTYRMYQEVSKYSLNTFPVRVTFINSDNPKDRFSSYGFFIEDIDHLAESFEGVEVETQGLDHIDLDPYSELTVSMFAYMIGHTDWYVKNLHNLKLIQIPGVKKPIPVPYDFDFSGLVDAPYASVSKDIKIKDNRERFFMGQCGPKSRYDSVYQRYRESQERIESMVNDEGLLSMADKNDMLTFLNEFFQILESPVKSKKYIEKKCWN